MTTKVTIDAHAGWPVAVSFIGPGSAQSAEIVPPKEERTFYVHSGQDILVHEVQPGETAIAKHGQLDFGSALRMLKAGARIARAGWNGKGMWLSLSGTPFDPPRDIPAESFWSTNNAEYAKAQGGTAKVLPCITMRTATGEILMGWLASQSDMLAEDWMLVDEHGQPFSKAP